MVQNVENKIPLIPYLLTLLIEIFEIVMVKKHDFNDINHTSLHTKLVLRFDKEK